MTNSERIIEAQNEIKETLIFLELNMGLKIHLLHHYRTTDKDRQDDPHSITITMAVLDGVTE